MDIMNEKDLHRLVKAATRKEPLSYSADETYSVSDVNDVLRAQFQALAPDWRGFRKNKNLIFDLIEESIDEILPARVMKQYEQFAETRVLAQGDKAIFRQRITDASRQRAKTFVTRVALAGRYETFKLDGREVEVQMSAIGAAVRLEFEEFLDGRWSFADFTDIILEGMDEYIYAEIAKALESAMKELPEANKVSVDKFDEKAMDELLAISESYFGGVSSIICTREFAAQMIPAEGWVSESMKDERWSKGYLGSYKGHSVILLAQSVEDTTNARKVIDPSNAYIIPNGADKPVKIAFEGPTCVKTIDDNDDWSQEMHTYKKFGVAVFTNPGICHYKNTSLKMETRA